MILKRFLLILFFISLGFTAYSQAQRQAASPQIEMVRIPAGTFTMGSNDELDRSVRAQPPHQVILTQEFWMGKYQVTQAQWVAVMGTNPSWFHGGTGREPADGEAQGKRPVEMVRWHDVLVFANRLSIMRGFTPAYEMETTTASVWNTNPDLWGTVPTSWSSPDRPRWDAVRIVPGSTGYRLPTEAQWEFAAKGGNTADNYTFSGSDNPFLVAWHSANSGNRTREVGRLAPNGLGLYDMSGNVWEWVWDWFGTYTVSPAIDPTGPNAGIIRVIRGGSWGDDADGSRSLIRSFGNPSVRGNAIGFRLVRPLTVFCEKNILIIDTWSSPD
ncbi:MAG: formylglycine-generating enzyme family protein [Spirochaetes bacterium]|nr:formylglycine-generating enzyme family protein [Spirochaetota bacterium]